MIDEEVLVALVKRRAEMIDWLEAECPDVYNERKHLKHGSDEQAYWHHGYQEALADVLESLLTTEAGLMNVSVRLH